MKAVRRALRTAGFAAAAAGVLPLHTIHERLVPEREREALKERYKRAWCGGMLRWFGITLVELDPVPPMRDGRGRLVVSNHRSAIDIAILFRVFGGHMLSRADISDWPILGAMARRVGTVFVDRSSTSSGAAAIRELVLLLEANKCVSVFAEGTTFEGDEVHPFHHGAFLAAIRASAEIVPVGLAYEHGSDAAYRDETFLAHLGRVAGARPSRAAIAIGAPLKPRARAKESAQEAHACVTELVRRARASLA